MTASDRIAALYAARPDARLWPARRVAAEVGCDPCTVKVSAAWATRGRSASVTPADRRLLTALVRSGRLTTAADLAAAAGVGRAYAQDRLMMLRSLGLVASTAGDVCGYEVTAAGRLAAGT